MHGHVNRVTSPHSSLEARQKLKVRILSDILIEQIGAVRMKELIGEVITPQEMLTIYVDKAVGFLPRKDDHPEGRRSRINVHSALDAALRNEREES
jgi:hypothetical protein